MLYFETEAFRVKLQLCIIYSINEATYFVCMYVCMYVRTYVCTYMGQIFGTNPRNVEENTSVPRNLENLLTFSTLPLIDHTMELRATKYSCLHFKQYILPGLLHLLAEILGNLP